jgi:hypothetical protein
LPEKRELKRSLACFLTRRRAWDALKEEAIEEF